MRIILPILQGPITSKITRLPSLLITDPLFDRKFDDATSGLEPFLANTLNDICTENLGSIINYLLALRTEINLSDNYRRLNIVALCKFSNK